jgi:cyclopropane fatty-acyl-phospholipid synthase-like methyltransferase
LAASPAVARWGQAVFDTYVGQTSHTLVAHVDSLIRLAGITAGTRALELGSGAGGFGCYVAARTGCRLEGIDWSEVGLQLANQRAVRLSLPARASFRRADLRDPQLPDETYDVVFAIDATYFGLDLTKLATQVVRALRGAGRFAALATVPAGTAAEAGAITPGAPAEVGLTTALGAAGFVEVAVQDLTNSYADLVARMNRQWYLDLSALRLELGQELADARLAEDNQILRLLRAGALRRLLCVARRAP